MKEQNNWFTFAEEDLKMTEAALREQLYNQVCFHSQQGVEKTLKGFLRSHAQGLPKTHLLQELLTLCIQIDPDFKSLKSDCAKLDDYYIPTRYPDALPGIFPEGLPNENDASESLLTLQKIMNLVASKIAPE